MEHPSNHSLIDASSSLLSEKFLFLPELPLQTDPSANPLAPAEKIELPPITSPYTCKLSNIFELFPQLSAEIPNC
jgi:hypothetical protein